MSSEEYTFTSEDIARGPPGYISPLSVEYSPNNKYLTYLFPDERGVRKVFAIDLDHPDKPHFKLFDPETDEGGQLSLQEQLRRERMRLFTHGISSYEWSNLLTSTNQKMIIPLNGKILLYDSSISSVESEQCHVVFDPSESDINGLNIGDAIDPHLSPDGKSVAFVSNDDLYVLHLPTAEYLLQRCRNSSDTGPGKGTLHRLTTNGAKPGVTCGLADFLAQEEMDRYRGFWWSPDSKSIVYAEADESIVPEFTISHLGKADPTHCETHRYPFSGKVNPKVSLAVALVPPATAEAVWLSLVDPSDRCYTSVASLSDPDITEMNTQDEVDFYVCRVGWWPDGSVMVQVENRAQSVLQLLRVDAKTGKRTILLEEKSDIWINLHDMLHCFPSDWKPPSALSETQPGDFFFLWASERTGFSQLYLYQYNATGSSTTCLTTTPIGGGGDFVVEDINAVDEVEHVVYFTGNREHPTEKHLYCASYLPEKCTVAAVRLTSLPGWHNCTVHPKLGLVADSFSSVMTPSVFLLYRMKKTANELISLASDANELLEEIQQVTDGSELDYRLKKHPSMRGAMITPSLHVIRSEDDKVNLYCHLYLPPQSVFLPDNAGQEQRPVKLPAVVSVYGGPHVQRVYNNWLATADLRAQRLAQSGFAVIKCDNRGSYRRGIAFEGALHRDMGNIEVQDQRAAVNYFAREGIIDPEQVGIFGWSYGGYMSAMGVCRAPDTFKCGVAGAPVTSWDGYDTHYTERYMGTPQNNPVGYQDSSVMEHVSGMTPRNKLMLVHGLIDENVHFRHTARLINTMIEKRRKYELMLFPCERHSPHKLQDKIYMEDLMLEFFSKHLLPSSGVSSSGDASGVVRAPETSSATTVKITARI